MITQTDSPKKNIHSSLYKSASISNDLSKISQIHEDEINISIWRRILSNSTIKILLCPALNLLASVVVKSGENPTEGTCPRPCDFKENSPTLWC